MFEMAELTPWRSMAEASNMDGPSTDQEMSMFGRDGIPHVLMQTPQTWLEAR